MTVARSTAVMLGTAAIAAALGFEWFQARSCFLIAPASAWVALLPAACALLPALFWLASPRPLNALGAVAFISPLLALAYHAGCVSPPAGTSPAMVYAVLVVYGMHLGIAGALIAGVLLRLLGIAVAARPQRTVAGGMTP